MGQRRSLLILFGALLTWVVTGIVITVGKPTEADPTSGGEDPLWLVIVGTGGVVIAGLAVVIGVLGLFMTGRHRRILRVAAWRRTAVSYAQITSRFGQYYDHRVGIVAHDLAFGDPTVISLNWNTRLALARSRLAEAEWAEVAGDHRMGFVVRGPETKVLLSGRLVKRGVARLLLEAAAVPVGSRVGRSGYYRRR